MSLHPKQIESILNLSGSERYDYFIKQVADKAEAWGLFSDGWSLAQDDEGNMVFPLWPAEEYAKLCAIGDWAGHEARSIDIDDLMDGLLPKAREDGTQLGIFPSPTERGVVPTIDAFEADMNEELSKFE